jgi:hypothetical protein
MTIEQVQYESNSVQQQQEKMQAEEKERRQKRNKEIKDWGSKEECELVGGMSLRAIDSLSKGTTMITTDEAADKRNEGMDRAEDHAEHTSSGWGAAAASLLEKFVQERGSEPFLAEDFVDYARTKILSPPDKRAFGPVLSRAAKAGVIRKDGYALAKTSNLSPKVKWVVKSERQDG